MKWMLHLGSLVLLETYLHLDFNKPLAPCGLEAKQVTVLYRKSSRNIEQGARKSGGKEHNLALQVKTWSVPQIPTQMNLWVFKKITISAKNQSQMVMPCWLIGGTLQNQVVRQVLQFYSNMHHIWVSIYLGKIFIFLFQLGKGIDLINHLICPL